LIIIPTGWKFNVTGFERRRGTVINGEKEYIKRGGYTPIAEIVEKTAGGGIIVKR